ncbi:MAG: esterase [Planctomycetia bacterium]|nr:esterase [Planctomycetia bacterium]
MTEPSGAWSEVTVAGKTCDVFEPAGAASATSAAPQAVLIYLHGIHLNRLVDQPQFTAQFTRYGWPIIAPRCGRCWWTDRVCAEFDPQLTPEQHLLKNIVPYIAERWDVRPPGIALLGTSMGGQGALRLAFRHPNVFPLAAAISPAIDFHLRYDEQDETLPLMYADAEAARQDTATLHVHPLNWPRNLWFCCDPLDYRWHESAERLRMKLSALGIPHDHDLETSGGGHGFEYYNRMAPTAAKFLAERLERERRRVP